jgi:hypothetical protein
MLSIVYRGQQETLIGWTPSTQIRKGQMNRLAVRAESDALSLYINDKQEAALPSDYRLPSGAVGLAVDTGPVQGESHAAFRFEKLELRAR